MPLQRLECEVQNYAWGKIGSESKVARFKQVEGTKIDEVRKFFFFVTTFRKFVFHSHTVETLRGVLVRYTSESTVTCCGY